MESMERALYQKHRLQVFGDIAEQPQVVSVLEKAVAGGSVAHAYLFTGPRGIGKTSVARIFVRVSDCKVFELYTLC